jgi:hypothetical protein
MAFWQRELLSPRPRDMIQWFRNLITVKAGDVLAFAVQLTDPDAAWEGAEGNLYTRGSHFVLTAGRWEPTASDLGFQSFVTIPEPSTLAFASLFFLACLLQKRAFYRSGTRFRK